MRYVSLFSGIEAASVAWEPLGWEPMAFSEIDQFPCAVLEYRFPNVPNLGDITKVDWSEFIERFGKPDVVVGGSPCQSFSIAGGRDSLSGESRLMFEYIRALRDLRPDWFLWENVPGVLNTRDDAFAQLLREVQEIGYVSLAWRVLDAQFFGVAQRRRRVFLVGHLGEGGSAAAVLFERESVSGNTQSSKSKRKELTGAAYERSSSGFKWHQGANAGSIGYEDEQSPTLVADWHNPAVLAFNDTQITNPKNGNNPKFGDECHTLSATDRPPCIALQGDGTTSLSIHGSGYSDDGSAYTLNCIDRHSVMCIPINTMIATRGNKLGEGTGFGVGEDGDAQFTLSTAHHHAVMCANEDDIICMSDGQADAKITKEVTGTLNCMHEQPIICMANANSNAEIGYDYATTQTARQYKDPPIICVGSDSSKASVDIELAGTLHVGGGCSMNSETVGALCARDYKGVGNQYVDEGKVVCQRIV